jgi:hypothetical protein
VLQAAPVRIRTATEDDAAAIAEVHVASWRGAYRGVVPDQVLDGADLLDGRRRMWQRLLGDATPAGHAAWVAEADGQVVAFADVLPSRDDDADERARRFYERAGFAPDGASNVLHRLGHVTEIRYRRPQSPLAGRRTS